MINKAIEFATRAHAAVQERDKQTIYCASDEVGDAAQR